jgi:8-oxo-dGTP diphosphatase
MAPQGFPGEGEADRFSVAGIAVEDGRLFIARRLRGGDLGGKWEFPGGKVEPGETDGEALVREFEEEFGIPIKTGPFLGAASFEHRGLCFTVRAYRIYFPHQNFTLAEHSEWRWAGPEDIEKLDFAGSDLRLLTAIRENLKRQT